VTGRPGFVAATGQQPQRHHRIISRDDGQVLAVQPGEGHPTGIDRADRAWPAQNTRARADSSAGTPTAGLPPATRRGATRRPVPSQPSAAQARSLTLRPAASITL